MAKRITKSAFEKLQKSLREMDKGWVEKLVDLIKEKECQADDCAYNPQKIYNVFNDRVRDGKSKLIIFKYGKVLLASYVKEMEKIS